MTREEICARLPHAGRMCLLDQLVSWDADNIVCRTGSHRAADNPLRSHDRLHAVVGVEYAAQAMALHGGLLAAGDVPPAKGYLASVRSLKLHVDDLSRVREDLEIRALRLGGEAGGFIYEFEIRGGDQLLLSGRVTAKLLTTGETT